MNLDSLLHTILVCGTIVSVASLIIGAVSKFSAEHSAMYQIEKILNIDRPSYLNLEDRAERHYALIVKEVRRIMEAVGK